MPIRGGTNCCEPVSASNSASKSADGLFFTVIAATMQQSTKSREYYNDRHSNMIQPPTEISVDAIAILLQATLQPILHVGARPRQQTNTEPCDHNYQIPFILSGKNADTSQPWLASDLPKIRERDTWLKHPKGPACVATPASSPQESSNARVITSYDEALSACIRHI